MRKMEVMQYIKKEIETSIEVKQRMLANPALLGQIKAAADCMTQALQQDGKILVCGNGGSASDALHIAGEIVGRFQKERKAYAVIALNADVAVMTAVANDYAYEQVFARQVEGLMNERDVLLGISTSGNSENVIHAFEKAKQLGGKTILLSGKDGGALRNMADIALVVPSDVTAHIQEGHECVYHILCGLVEQVLA